MAENDEWCVAEDGILVIGQPVKGVIFHQTLNTILVVTADNKIKTLDVTSGLLLQDTQLAGV